MGAECPNGHGRQNIVENINVEGKKIIKGDDVQARKLACGCVVGGPEYEDFQKQVHDIRAAESRDIAARKEKARLALGAAYQAYSKKEVDAS